MKSDLEIDGKGKEMEEVYRGIAEESEGIFRESYRGKFKKQIDVDSTVLCSFSLYRKGWEKAKIVSVGFGTKSLPESIASEHKGKVIKDMHAQILARRGLLKFLIENLPEKTKQTDLYLWNSSKQKHKLHPSLQLILYSTEPFCGSCTINESTSLFSGARPLKYFLVKQIPQEKYSAHCLRTKPGRLDLPLEKRTLSLSCSDKIGVWNILGVQGKRVFNYLMPVYIGAVVIKTEKEIDRSTIGDGINFLKRLKLLRKESEDAIERKLFEIVIDGKMKTISGQFYTHSPQITVLKGKQKSEKQLGKEEAEQEAKKFQMCGIVACGEVSWLSGRTGLPEGVSLKKPGKISPFATEKLYHSLKSNQEQQFKYHAVKDRIKMLFGQWTDTYRTKK